jgi:hypothetical protein
MPEIPRLDSISQSIAVSGFTDDALDSGHLDLTQLLPANAFVQGWRAEITTRFTITDQDNLENKRSTSGGEILLAVGTAERELAFSSKGFQQVNGMMPSPADVPLAAEVVAPVARHIRVTLAETATQDFGSIAGGAVTVTVYFIRTEA